MVSIQYYTIWLKNVIVKLVFNIDQISSIERFSLSPQNPYSNDGLAKTQFANKSPVFNQIKLHETIMKTLQGNLY